MTLAQVLDGVKLCEAIASPWAELPVAGLAYDSRRVQKDFVFFAFPGSRADGRKFADNAITQGACAIVSESPVLRDIRRALLRRGLRHGLPPGFRCSTDVTLSLSPLATFTGNRTSE